MYSLKDYQGKFTSLEIHVTIEACNYSLRMIILCGLYRCNIHFKSIICCYIIMFDSVIEKVKKAKI